MSDHLELFQNPLPPSELEVIWLKYDINGDGSVDREEAKQLVKSLCEGISAKLIDRLARKMTEAKYPSSKKSEVLSK